MLPVQRVQRFRLNTDGRDFVVGDVHGAFGLVRQAMRQANFNPEVDRLFALGDLIDRGENSYQCAAFLAQPGVYAVSGNHERMLLDLHESGFPREDVEFMVSRNGFGWWLSTPPAQQAAILAAIKMLPLAIEVETARGTVGLIHADVPAGMAWPTFLQRLEAGDPDAVTTCLWGRDRIRHGRMDGVAGVGRVFVGHTPQWNGVKRYGNVLAIDSGAIYGEQGQAAEGCLTMALTAARTGLLLARRNTSALVDLRHDPSPPVTPFSECAAPC